MTRRRLMYNGFNAASEIAVAKNAAPRMYRAQNLGLYMVGSFSAKFSENFGEAGGRKAAEQRREIQNCANPFPLPCT